MPATYYNLIVGLTAPGNLPMPCLIGCLGLLVPRGVLLALFLFTPYLDQAFKTRYWPFLGFLIMPLTTLTYAYAKHTGDGRIDGLKLAIIFVAAMFDLGLLGGGGWKARARRRRMRLGNEWEQ